MLLFDKATRLQKRRLLRTCRYFGLQPSRILAEVLLRLDRKFQMDSLCPIPQDESSKKLLEIYSYYYKTCLSK